MTGLGRYAAARLVRTPGRTTVQVLSLSAACALLGAMILFVGHSLQTMTAGAVRTVPLDWQGPVGSYGAATKVARRVARQPGIAAAEPVATAPFASMVHRGVAGTIRASAGALLAVPPDYTTNIATLRLLRGSLRPGEIVLDQQLAATLQAEPGQVIGLTPRPGGRPLRLRVGGVALVTAPDVLFQPLNPSLGPAPAQPPANIAIVSLPTFAGSIAPELHSIGPVTPTAATLPGTLSGVQWEVEAQVDPSALTGSPAHALARAGQIRNRVERTLPGQVVFVDNLSDGLATATADALYAETLYIMLAVPGALIALALAYLAALGTAERDRAELALLRARGGSRGQLVAVGAVESLVLGLTAGVLGTGAALLAVRLTAPAGATGPVRVAATFGICSAVAVLGAAAARLGAGLSVLGPAIQQSRSGAERPRHALWQRLWLDALFIAGSGLIYWLTARTGFSAVVNPDSNPTLSLSVYMFLAPALLWIGAALLLVRLRGQAFAWAARRVVGGRASTRTGFLLAAAGRRGAALNRGLIVTGLLLAFGVQLGLFTATYDRQSRVDAELTLGADVVLSAPPGAVAKHGIVQQVAREPGAAAATPVDHTYAYVGPDLQDMFGIDPESFTRATSLHDSYFLGGSARDTLANLVKTPDGVLVSKETITDYSLGRGDLLRLRLFDRRSGRFRVVPFHVVGIVQEFPSAPRDSFMVANLAYLEEQTHAAGPNVVFVKASGDPASLARHLAQATHSEGTLVKDITAETAQTVSSITAVDLAGISRIEEAFAVILAAAATALFVVVALAERRREFATMASLGASLRDIGAFVWSEAAVVVGGALALAALLGWLLAEMLVAMLRHVFDPPPDRLTAPWTFLAWLCAAAVGGALVASAAGAIGIRRLPLGEVLREE